MRKFVVFSLVLFFDFCTKYWVDHSIPLMRAFSKYPFGGIGLFKSSFVTLSIVHTTNTGTAWGLFSNLPGLLLFARLAITGVIIFYLVFMKPPKHLQMPLTIIAAGALGNIIDFFVYGHVVDMIYFIFYNYSYPIFNIADSAIFCAVAYMLITSYRLKKPRAGKSA